MKELHTCVFLKRYTQLLNNDSKAYCFPRNIVIWILENNACAFSKSSKYKNVHTCTFLQTPPSVSKRELFFSFCLVENDIWLCVHFSELVTLKTLGRLLSCPKSSGCCWGGTLLYGAKLFYYKQTFRFAS